MEANNGGLQVIASDGISLIKASIVSIKCEGDISLCLPSKTLISAIKEIPDQPIEIFIDDDYNITVKYATGHFELKGLSSEEYPIKSIEKGQELNLKCEEFIYNIRKARNFCSSDELRPVLTGILFKADKTGLMFSASDSTKLCLLELSISNLPEVSTIISANDAKLISDIFDSKLDISINISNRCSCYKCGDYEIISTNLEGRFPDVRKVIPQHTINTIQLNKNEIISAIKRVSLFASINKLIVCDFGCNLRIESKDIDYSTGAEEVVNIEMPGINLKIGFNANMLIDVLSAIKTDTVAICLETESKPGLFTGLNSENERYVLMPIMIK